MAVGFEDMLFDESQTDFANHRVALGALSEIYGPDEQTLEAHRAALSEPPWLSDINHMGFPWGRVALHCNWTDAAACLCMNDPGFSVFPVHHSFRRTTCGRSFGSSCLFHISLTLRMTLQGYSSRMRESCSNCFPSLSFALRSRWTIQLAVMEPRLLQFLFHKHGPLGFESAEEELRLVLTSRDASPLHGRDYRNDFRPTPLLTARRFVDGKFVRSESKKQSEPGEVFERGTGRALYRRPETSAWQVAAPPTARTHQLRFGPGHHPMCRTRAAKANYRRSYGGADRHIQRLSACPTTSRPKIHPSLP